MKQTLLWANTCRFQTKMIMVLMFIFSSFNAWSQVPPANKDSVKVTVVPDHANWIYKTGEPFICHVQVTAFSIKAKNVKIVYEAGLEKMPVTISKSILLPAGEATINCGTLKAPGFLRCKVTAQLNGKYYTGVATAGFDPLQIQPTAKVPDDFLKFWQNARADALKIPLDARMSLWPERCTEKSNVYQISFQSYRPGSRIYGVLCIPKAPGKYAALLKLPGAGVRAYKGYVDFSDKGGISLEIGIHGIPLTLGDSVYDALAAGALNNYQLYNFDNKNSYYYKRVIMGCLRAIDFIYTLPQFDGNKLALFGQSQGGGLSIITAALDSRVKYLAVFYPALSDMTGYLYGRAGGWPHAFSQSALETVDREKLETAGYYDVANFARFIKVPGIYTWGFNDETCPPTSTFAAYNVITAPKEIFNVPDTGHWAYPLQWQKLLTWLYSALF